jgi:hypothetical protein
MKMRVALTLIMLWLTGTEISFARDVFVSVSTGQIGHGFLRQKKDKCYVIMPKHVVEAPGEIVVTIPGGDTSNASVFKVDPSADLAILILASKDLCGGLEGTITKASVEGALSDAASGILHTITNDGSSLRRKISIDEVTDQTVSFEMNGTKTLQKGDSGSIINVGEVQVGMLIEVPDPDGTKGNAYKQTVIEDFWARVMQPSAPCSEGCSFVASAKNFEKFYNPQTVDGAAGFSTTTIHFDFVFRVPDAMPLPPFFHVWKDKLVTEVGSAGAVASVSTSTFSFSHSSLDRDAEVTVIAFGFDTLGSTTSTITLKNVMWSIKILRESDTDYLVTLKPYP